MSEQPWQVTVLAELGIPLSGLMVSDPSGRPVPSATQNTAGSQAPPAGVPEAPPAPPATAPPATGPARQDDPHPPEDVPPIGSPDVPPVPAERTAADPESDAPPAGDRPYLADQPVIGGTVHDDRAVAFGGFSGDSTAPTRPPQEEQPGSRPEPPGQQAPAPSWDQTAPPQWERTPSQADPTAPAQWEQTPAQADQAPPAQWEQTSSQAEPVPPAQWEPAPAQAEPAAPQADQAPSAQRVQFPPQTEQPVPGWGQAAPQAEPAPPAQWAQFPPQADQAPPPEWDQPVPQAEQAPPEWGQPVPQADQVPPAQWAQFPAPTEQPPPDQWEQAQPDQRGQAQPDPWGQAQPGQWEQASPDPNAPAAVWPDLPAEGEQGPASWDPPQQAGWDQAAQPSWGAEAAAPQESWPSSGADAWRQDPEAPPDRPAQGSPASGPAPLGPPVTGGPMAPRDLVRRSAYGDPLVRRMSRGVRRAMGAAAANDVRKATDVAAVLSRPVPSCRQIVVTSIRGGAGKTTVAGLTATVIAQYRQDRVLAVDADSGLGSLPLRMGVGPRLSLHDLTSSPQPRSFEEASRYLAQTTDGLWVLSGTAGGRITGELDLTTFRTAAGVMSRYFAASVIDCGAGLLPELQRGIMAEAHAQVMVTPGTVDGALSAHGALEWQANNGYEHLLPRTVIAFVTHTPHVDADLTRAAQMLSSGGLPVVHIPYDRHLAAGTAVESARIGHETRAAVIRIAVEAFARAVAA
ncbi:hypothetical protein NE235_34945 [Actinoallomurus spadix]|uniref:MinD/ParA family protein n=1 Tax=Actinoallomurus spadix TaxID=79912 RepID=A0ABN0XP35_9ACTN|nr:MinD/ParA family protein [Actinoallomurus spadix]MCO5991324.1 hypothetical protein [Actinoallomurus spadix]